MSDQSLTGQVEFIAAQAPALGSGDYEITITQTVQEKNGKKITSQRDNKPVDDEKFSATQAFSVFGPRFELTPQEIHAVFPPPGSRGDHNHVLPHIIFDRSTLPWERKVGECNTWLALLVFYEEEKQNNQVLDPKICTLIKNGNNWELQEAKKEADPVPQKMVQSPKFSVERAQSAGDQVTVVDVQSQLLQALLPTIEDLKYVSHIRQRVPIGSDAPNPQAIVIANRLPKNQGTSIVHLVSLEGQYGEAASDLWKVLESINNDSFVRLVSLKSWSFSCLEPKYNFKGLLLALNQSADGARDLLLRLPDKDFDASLAAYITKGYVPLPHFMRKGDKSISWYHSPLIPWENSPSTNTSPIQVADQLLHYDSQTGLLDVSYAAAWQLGRLLALQDKRLSVSLFNWKHTRLQNHHQVNQFSNHAHLLPEASQKHLRQGLPPSLEDQTWFHDLNLLEDVPFNYLVPDERMLPDESLRFFWVDPQWVDCLLKGAFSIGETVELQPLDRKTDLTQNRYPELTGFLLRSEVVAGYPGLLVDGYKAGEKLNLRRIDRLSENVLLCLFEGEIQSVTIYQKPETMHFGFDETKSKDLNGNEISHVQKQLKDDKGKNTDQLLKSIPFQDEKRNVVNVHALADAIKAGTSAQFALQMIEGTPLITFNSSLT